MSIRVSAEHAAVHWLSNEASGGKLTRNQAVLYRARSPNKLGQVTRDSAEGLTPQEVFEHRYGGDKSGADTNRIAEDLFVIDKHSGANHDYDDGVRALINDLFAKGRIPFRANVNHQQEDNTNSEALIGYVRDDHLDILVNVIKQYQGLGEYYDTRDPIVWRWGQEPVITETLEILKQERLALFAGYTSFGKTKVSVEIATQLLPRGGIVLVTTPITDTKTGFRDNIRDCHFGEDRTLRVTYMDSGEFVRHTPRQLATRARNHELIFVVLTVQDLRYDEVGDRSTEILRNKYQALSGMVDLWVRDERHTQYGGEITSQRLANMTATYELDLTATPYNVLDNYNREQVVTRTLIWALLNRDKTGVPLIGIDCVNTPMTCISDRIASLFSAEEGWDGRKLFLRTDGVFELEAEILEIDNRLYHSTLKKTKNPLSISNDTGLDSVAKRCGLWVLPDGQNGDGAADYIPDLAHLLNRKPGTLYTDSYTLTAVCNSKKIKIGDWVEHLLTIHDRVVILTCGKFLTGTDIPALGHIVLFDKISSIMTFEQIMGRMIRNYPGKDRVKLYTFAPAMELKLLMGRIAQANAELSGGTEYEYLDCIPLTEYGINTVVQITPQTILTDMATWSHDQLRARLPQYSLLNLLKDTDTSLWDTINVRSYKNVAPATEMTEETGSRVKNKINPGLTKEEQQRAREERTRSQLIAEAIQTVVAESSDVAYTQNCYDYRKLFLLPQLTERFEQGECTAALDTARQSLSISNMLDQYYAERKLSWAHLPYTEIRPVVFANTDRRLRQGMVFTPDSIITELLDKIGI